MATRYLGRVTGVSAVAILAAMSGPALAQSAAELRSVAGIYAGADDGRSYLLVLHCRLAHQASPELP